MGLQYVVAKRIFGFDKDKNVKYVAKSVGAGELDFDKLCAKVSRSSKIKIFGLLSNACAIPTLCFIPPEKVFTFLFATWLKSTTSNNSVTRFFATFFGIPFSAAIYIKNSTAV